MTTYFSIFLPLIIFKIKISSNFFKDSPYYNKIFLIKFIHIKIFNGVITLFINHAYLFSFFLSTSITIEIIKTEEMRVA